MTTRTALVIALALGLAVASRPADATLIEHAAAQVDTIVREANEQPERARVALEQWQLEHGATPHERRLALQALGAVLARNGGAARAVEIADRLQALASADPSGQTQAAADLVHAQAAEAAGEFERAGTLAQSAATVFQAGCNDPSSPLCDYRAAWSALMLLERRASGQGVTVTAARHAQAALDLAVAAGDAPRQATNYGRLAILAQGRGEHDAAVWLMAQARRAAASTSSPVQQARLSNVQAVIASMQGDRIGALRSLEEALGFATAAKAPWLQALTLVNLGDAYARLGRPADALRAAERALPVVRAHNDVRNERILINNIGIAKIGLGRINEGKQDLARVLELSERAGETGKQMQTLLEFGEALAAAGDARGALDLYHRERALSAELMRVNRDAALKDLQTRNEADARERDIELLGRDNALKTAALANRELVQRIWWLVATVLLLSIVLVAMLYRRVRETNRRLSASHLQLQAQSERDPLTNLANRRQFQQVMARQSMAKSAANAGFEGALLLVDIDHFKHINDVHGHAAGDQVLVEVARRLNEAVRGDDLVVRWGGEEFLILAPRAGSERAEQMAARVLRALADTPVAVETAALRVTASIGYGRFPLPPYGIEMPWEQAVNLADMALYTAKNQGRNRSVGITSTTAANADALRAIEADFDRAWHDGQVTLVQTAGPQPLESLQVA